MAYNPLLGYDPVSKAYEHALTEARLEDSRAALAQARVMNVNYICRRRPLQLPITGWLARPMGAGCSFRHSRSPLAWRPGAV